MKCLAIAIAVLLAGRTSAFAGTFYVSQQGDDSASGQTIDHAWKTCAKLLKTHFAGGDTVLFQRGGEWHERLEASSDGAAGNPITYDAYGQGPKPRFWGSDVLVNANFKPAGDGRFTYQTDARADSALADHVFIPSTWSNNTLTLTTGGSDPRTDGKLYTACMRGNVIFSARKNHLVFRNLIVDETAGQLTEGVNQGYGVRIEGSTDVLLEYCEAYRCGRHHFAAINTTEFIGRHLLAAYVQPNTPGDNTPYVSYADHGAPVEHCITTWDDIAASHMEDGHGGQSVMFVSHGDQVGLLTIKNSTLDLKISFMSAPVVVEHVTLQNNGTIENFGNGIRIDGCRLLGSSTIDQYGSNGLIENCVGAFTTAGAGPTGYSTAILCRAKAVNNVVRFNSLATHAASGLCLAGPDSQTSWYGNIFQATRDAVAKPAGSLEKSDVKVADYNCYLPGATLAGESFESWKLHGSDPHSISADPKFARSEKGELTLLPGSPCIETADVESSERPRHDMAGASRPAAGPMDMGAYSAQPGGTVARVTEDRHAG